MIISLSGEYIRYFGGGGWALVGTGEAAGSPEPLGGPLIPTGAGD